MFDHGLSLRFVEDTRIHLHRTDKVGIDVGSGSPILDITLSVCVSGRSWDTEGGGSISDTEREFANIRGFMVTSHSLLVVVTVETNM